MTFVSFNHCVRFNDGRDEHQDVRAGVTWLRDHNYNFEYIVLIIFTDNLARGVSYYGSAASPLKKIIVRMCGLVKIFFFPRQKF